MSVRVEAKPAAYVSGKTGWSLWSFQIVDPLESGIKTKYVKVAGTDVPSSKSTTYALDLEYNPRFRSYNLIAAQPVLVTETNGVQDYLCSLSGIGPVRAQKIVETLGQGVLDIIDTAPERLLNVPGIGKKQLQAIMASWNENRNGRDEIVGLIELGFASKQAQKIFKALGVGAALMVTGDVFQAYAAPGIGWDTCEELRAKRGEALDTDARIRAGLVEVLKRNEIAGHTYIRKEEYYARVCRLLFGDHPTCGQLGRLNAVSQQELLEGRIKTQNAGQFLMRFEAYKAEQLIAYRADFNATYRGEAWLDWPRIREGVADTAEQMGLTMDPLQVEAVVAALEQPLSIVTGGPGTGKTSIMRVLLQVVADHYRGIQVALMAPTGKAARRLAEATGHDASTIHHALGLIGGDDGQELSQMKSELEADLVIVDEASMMDVFVAEKFFSSLRKGSKVVLIGDADQLPSVSAGNVLADFISSGKYPVTRLTHVYRTADGSVINANCHRMAANDTALEWTPDFILRQVEAAPDFAAMVEQMADDFMQEARRVGLDGVVCLAPYRDNVAQLNGMIQARLGHVDGVRRGKRLYCVGDRVMHLHNEQDVVNGDVGNVVRTKAGTVTVKYENTEKTYAGDELDNLTLAYAMTVHKSQGSEYPVVIMGLTRDHGAMLYRNIAYTAASRAKERFILVGEAEALTSAIRHPAPARQTALAQFIRVGGRLIRDPEKLRIRYTPAPEPKADPIPIVEPAPKQISFADLGLIPVSA